MQGGGHGGLGIAANGVGHHTVAASEVGRRVLSPQPELHDAVR